MGQTLLHYWNFNDTVNLLTPTTTLPSAPATLQVTPAGADVLSGTGTFTGANAVASDEAGSHLRVNNPYTTTTLSKTVLLRVPSSGYRNVVVRYETYRSTTGAQTQQVSYTTNGTSFVSLPDVTVPTVPEVVTLDFSAVPGVEGNPNFALQITFAGGTAGNNRFDNLTVHGTLIPAAPVAGIRINEVMSSNIETLLDADQDPSDWIELVNTQSTSINLLGYGLSDDPGEPFKWVFPNVTLGAGRFLVIFASEKDRRPTTPGSRLHTNFKISSNGDSIVLTAPGGALVDLVAAPALGKDVSHGRLSPTGGTFRYFKPATPGVANVGPGFDGMVPSPTLSAPPGFYAAPVAVNATLAGVTGATLRYTLNGDEPTESSPVLTGPVTLQSRAGEGHLWASIPTATNIVYTPPGPGKWAWSGGTGWDNGPLAETYKINTLRVRAFKSGFLPSKAVSGSYIVDPAGATRYRLPVVSIMTDYNSLFHATKGLFIPTNYFSEGIQWERPAHLEFFENQALGFDQDIGIRIHGGYSRHARLKSLRIYSRSQYEADAINYPIFPGDAHNIHERIILRAGGSEWAGVAFRDAFAQSLIKDISEVPIQRHRAAVVFINGEYWGIERFRDRYDNNYLKLRYGVDDVDILENEGRVKEGSNQTYLELVNYLTTEDLNAAGRYDWVQARMDTDNFRDYHIAQTFYMNPDQPGYNVDFWRSQTVDPGNPHADGRWRWLLLDVDVSLGYEPFSRPDRNGLVFNTGLNDINATTVNPKSTSPPSAPNTPSATLPLRRMLSNLQFRQDFIIRFADLLNTVFATPHFQARLGEFKSEVEPYMPEHIARWGYPASMGEWNNLIGAINTFGLNRPAYMRQHLQNFFYLAGTNKVTVNVAAAGSGRVKVNTVTVGEGAPGIPTPAFPWSGIYFRGLPVTLQAVPEPGFQFSHWTGDVPSGSAASGLLTLPLAGDLSLTATFVPAALPVLRQYWSFNETNALLEPQLAAGSAAITITPGPTTEVVSGTGQNFQGLNAQGGDPAATHLRLNNPIGAEMMVRLPTTGVEDAVVRYETRRSGSGAGTQQIAYTTDGAHYIPFRTLAVTDGNPVLVVLDFSALPAVDNNPLFALRITFEETGGGTVGNNRFDNLTLHGLTLPGFDAAGFPVLTAVPPLVVDEQATLSLNLTATDPDGNTPTFRLLHGPGGLTVSGAGAVSWFSGETLAGTTQAVLVRVTDNSTPPLSSLGRFDIAIRDLPGAVTRMTWQIGTDDDPLLPPYKPAAEFSMENHFNDPRPGKVTRLSGDPDYAGTANPDRDDDYYFAGTYPPGFNGLLAELRVPNDEPPSAWERGHAEDDRINRVHFVLSPNQVTASSRFRLTFELPIGGYQRGGVVQPGFSDHDFVVRFRNGAGLTTQLLSQRVSQKSTLVVEFLSSAVGATVGPNTLEIERTGPNLSDRSYWAVYDFLRLEHLPPVLRTAWQIGTDDDPLVTPYNPYAEFSSENRQNDPRPGKVTRLLGDPEYAGAANPDRDDDFYFSGIYPTGFNGLPAALNVPNDEPPSAWERALTVTDRTNRVHFALDSTQVSTGARLRLNFEIVGGGRSIGGVAQPGFGDHDLTVQFQNRFGATTPILSQRVSTRSAFAVELLASALGASAGPNTVEFVRTGPSPAGSSAWILFDHVRIESLTGGGVGLTRPGFDASADSSPGIGQILNGVISLEGVDYLTLTYDQPRLATSGTRYRVEASSDLITWADAGVVGIGHEVKAAGHTVTVRDSLPLGSTPTRFLRLRLIPGDNGTESHAGELKAE